MAAVTHVKDRVTVVIPTYNRADMIGSAIRSALEQTYGDLEVVVVDDGSTDDTAGAVQALGSDRVRYLRLARNAGAQAARNAGVRAATGGLIAFLDSDDEWVPRKIELQVEKLRGGAPAVGMVYCGILRVGPDGRHIREHFPRHRGRIFDDLLAHNVIGGMSVGLIRADVLRSVGPFDERLKARQDLDMWLRIARRYEVDFVAERLVIYHEHRGGRTSSNRRARLQGNLALLAKFRRELRDRPAVRAGQYYAVARLYGQTGNPAKEMRFLRRSLADRFDLRALARLAFMLVAGRAER